LTCTVDADTKFEPVTVSAKASPHAFSEAGAIEPRAGAGALMFNVAGDDVPPPGAGVKTVMSREPAEAMSAAGIVAVSWVADTKVVARLAALTRTTELLAKLVPVADSVKVAPPADAVAGLMLDREGAAGGATTANASEPEVPPPAEGGVATLTWAVVGLARSEAPMMAWSWVPLMKVVERGTPFHRTTEDEAKFAPVTVRVELGLPTMALLGESDVKTGAEVPEAGGVSSSDHTSVSDSGPLPP